MRTDGEGPGRPRDPTEARTVVALAVAAPGVAGLGYAAASLASAPSAGALLAASLPAVASAVLVSVAAWLYCADFGADARTVLAWTAAGVGTAAVVAAYLAVVGVPDLGLAVVLTVAAGALVGVSLGAYAARRGRIERLERYEAVVESARDGVFAVDDEGEVTLVNPTMAELVGTDRERLVGRDATDLSRAMTLAREPRGRGSGTELADDGGSGELFDVLWALTDGDRRVRVELDRGGGTTLELGVTGIRTGNGTEAVVVARDVTRYERLQQQLSVTNRILRHNLRTSMNLVVGHARALEVEAADEETAEHARAVRTEAEQLTDLAAKARSLSEIVESGGATERTEVDLAVAVREALANLAEEHPGVETAVEAPDRAVVRTHPRFEYAVAEAAENAVVHGDADDPRVEATVRRVDGWWEVRVADDGPGIPDYERKVLDRDAETGLDHGSGIGLWLMRWIVDLCDGRLSFEENDPRGTVVSIRVPAGETADRPGE